VPTEFQCLAYSARYASLSHVSLHISGTLRALAFGFSVKMKSLKGRIGSPEAWIAAFSSAPPSQKYRLLMICQAREWAWAGKGTVVMLGWDCRAVARVWSVGGEDADAEGFLFGLGVEVELAFVSEVEI
jgi:hypothetical protein